jgi:hypothetical protein
LKKQPSISRQGDKKMANNTDQSPLQDCREWSWAWQYLGYLQIGWPFNLLKSLGKSYCQKNFPRENTPKAELHSSKWL